MDINEFLSHHGVKGQKWGVRNARKVIQQEKGQIAAKQFARRYSKLTLAEYNALSTKDGVIKKGDVFKRTTLNPHNMENLYVSNNEADAANYRALVPTWSTKDGIPQKKYAQNYEITYTALHNLKSPSEKARVDAYIKLMDQQSIKVNDGSTVTGREFLRNQGLGNKVDKYNSRELALAYHGQLVAQQGIHKDPIATAYFKELAKQGYNVISDDNDKGILAKTPMYVLNSSKNLKTEKIQPLTSEEVNAAISNLKLPK